MYEREEDIDTLNTMLLHISDNCSPEQIEKFLMKGADINARDVFGRTSLMIASENGETDVVKFLLESGADVNVKDDNGNTALSYAVSKAYYMIHNNEEIINMLLKAGADVDCPCNDENKLNDSPLMIASFFGLVRIVIILLKYGADVNYKNLIGDTSLISAVDGALNDQYNKLGDYEKTIKLLINYGCDVNDKNEEGETALDVLEKYLLEEEEELGLNKTGNTWVLDETDNTWVLDETGVSTDSTWLYIDPETEDIVKSLASMLVKAGAVPSDIILSYVKPQNWSDI